MLRRTSSSGARRGPSGMSSRGRDAVDVVGAEQQADLRRASRPCAPVAWMCGTLSQQRARQRHASACRRSRWSGCSRDVSTRQRRERADDARRGLPRAQALGGRAARRHRRACRACTVSVHRQPASSQPLRASAAASDRPARRRSRRARRRAGRRASSRAAARARSSVRPTGYGALRPQPVTTRRAASTAAARADEPRLAAIERSAASAASDCGSSGPRPARSLPGRATVDATRTNVPRVPCRRAADVVGEHAERQAVSRACGAARPRDVVGRSHGRIHRRDPGPQSCCSAAVGVRSPTARPRNRHPSLAPRHLVVMRCASASARRPSCAGHAAARGRRARRRRSPRARASAAPRLAPPACRPRSPAARRPPCDSRYISSFLRLA